MPSAVTLLLTALAGALIGAFYFGGLWLTVQRLPTTGRPVLLTVGSFAVRLGLAVLGFYLVSGGNVGRLLAAVAGFLVVRLYMTYRLGPRAVRRDDAKERGPE